MGPQGADGAARLSRCNSPPPAAAAAAAAAAASHANSPPSPLSLVLYSTPPTLEECSLGTPGSKPFMPTLRPPLRPAGATPWQQRRPSHRPTSTTSHMTVDDTLVQRPLYGAAAQLAFPQRFADISDFRPVPDHQEVGAGCFSCKCAWFSTRLGLPLAVALLGRRSTLLRVQAALWLHASGVPPPHRPAPACGAPPRTPAGVC